MIRVPVNKSYITSALLMAALVFTSAGTPAAAELSPTLEKLKAAMAMDHRSEKNVARDDNREPLKAMEFCGLKDDMTVIEFGPGGGWYTEILGPVLQEKGELNLAFKAEWMKKLDPLLARDFMSAVKKVPIDIDWKKGEHSFTVGDLAIDVRNADLALNIREYHNFTTEGAAKLSAALFESLKPGGSYCIIDHTRRHMEPENPENGRRVDPVQLIKEVQAAGFVFVDYSDMFFKPDDELRYEVSRKTVKGNTDRFVLLFQKPE